MDWLTEQIQLQKEQATTYEEQAFIRRFNKRVMN